VSSVAKDIPRERIVTRAPGLLDEEDWDGRFEP
jgi:hypothetical protein